MEIHRIMKLQIRHIALILTLLLLGGMANEAWAAKVTYHILTLPIVDPAIEGNYDWHMRSEVYGHRLEAVKVVVDNQTTVELPAHYKSPLATGFTYYAPSQITIGSTVQLYTNNSNTKGKLYDVIASPTATPEGTAIPGTTAEYYVVYTYNESNTIAKLDGSVRYNIGIKGKGYLAYNRGRNDRPAVVLTAKVDAEMLASEDFMKVDLTKTGIDAYWKGGDNNKNKEEQVGSQLHFMFWFEGKDPYNIIICTAYNRDTTFIEKNENTNNEFVYKWYKGGQLISKGTANAFLASDIHKKYKTAWNSAIPNPTNPASDAMDGYFHGLTNGAIWGSVALLNNSDNSGYVFMGTRTVDGNGAVPTPGNDNKYYYLKFDNNNLTFNKLTAADASKTYSTEGIYPIKKVTFKVPTPFYKVSASDAHIVSVEDWVSQYTVDNDPIETKYLPAALRRKYCEFNGKFYKDAARTKQITKFSDADYDNTEGYKVYLGYDVSASIPFKAITPAASYNAATWTGATWYELTDEGSTQIEGMKLKYDNAVGEENFKNNGADGEYLKTSEFAFIGDPYELQVVYRNSTSGATPYFVGATGAPPTSPTDLSINSSVTEGFIWQLPYDSPTGSFLLQKYKGDGHWYWNAGHPDPVAINYSTKAHTYNVATANGQTVTFNISGLTFTEGNYITVTKGGTNQDQVTVTTEKIYVQSGGTASFTAAIKARGDSNKQFTLSIQEYNASNETQGAASVVTVNQNNDTFTSSTVQYSTDYSTRVKPLELPTFTYTYNIVDNDGNIAVKCTATQTVFSTLTLGSIPSAILSPFLVGEKLTFYNTYTGGGRSNLSGVITEVPASNANIYVSYTTALLTTRSIQLSNSQRFKVKLNEEYIYYDNDAGKLKVLSTPDVGASADYYTWRLEGGDPYAMKIYNVGKGQYVKVNGGTWGNDKSLDFVGSDGVSGDASRFIAMLGNYTGIYEVMAASGTTDLYHIGRPSNTGDETKIYSNATYAHGADELRFELAVDQAIQYTLIDKAGAELVSVSSYNPRLVLPAEYVSPLVDTYYYYPTKAKALTDNHENNITEISNDTDESDQGGDDKDYHVWVTYTVNNLIGFNNSGKVNENPYLLKFLEPYADGYYLEDGADKLIPYDGEDAKQGRIQAIYPYCNGDGNLNIYGETMRDEQMNGGSSTRPRWVWFFESANNDPYHVRIHSRSTISYKSVSHPTYLQTYAVHFNQDPDPDTEHIITGGALPGVASDTPTEYMILGLPGAYKLLTTQEISADEDGSGTIDEGETKRRSVTSLEQYWKTYNMLKLHVLGISNSTDAYSTDASTWVVPEAQRAALKTRLEALHIDKDSWHSYDVYANATRWNGYNDKEEGHEKKVVEKLEHWFQTFDMGNGTFNVESADIPPVLVLLDLHGWEIMRKPLPAANYPLGDEEIAALKVYDSPLVDKYYFYSNATKASGCHKYSLRLQDGKERDKITVNGVHYSSSSLGDLPPANAKGVKSNDVLNDQFVIYTVKEEYAQDYSYTLNYTEVKDANNKVTGYTGISETETVQPYLVLQNGRFYKDINTLASNTSSSYCSKPIIEHTNPEGGNVYDMIISPHNHGGTNNPILDNSGNFIGNNFWYVKPNQNIDEEMGIKWGTAVSGAEPLSKNATRVSYQKNKKNGFDPYNMQLQLMNNNDGTTANKYLTTHITSANRLNGVLEASYEGNDHYGNAGSTMVTLESKFNSYDTSADKGSEGHDHTNLQISNQTFMAVQDKNGNMQLMPRFDHSMRVTLENKSPWESQLTASKDHTKASIDNNGSMGPQTTFFVRPQRLIYHIIDNKGREALRYTRGGDSYPTVTEHFKSPLATDFTYYKGLAESETPAESTVEAWGAATGEFKQTATSADMLTDLVKLLPTAGTYQYRIGTRGAFTYKSVEVTKGLSEQQITGSFAAVDLNAVESNVYVRYNYDEDADREADRILLGQWFTVKLAGKDLQSNGTIVTTAGETQGTGVNLYADNTESPTKPATINASAKKWQWKFLQAPTDPSSDYYEVPDPYAVQIFNRESNYTDDPTTQPSPMAVGIKVPNANTGTDRFALLHHPSGGYALVVAKTYTNNIYPFLNGADMTTSVAATTKAENRHKLTVADATAYNTEKAALNIDGEYYYKYGNGDNPLTYSYRKVTVTGGTPDAGVDCSEDDWNAGDTYNFTYKIGNISAGAQVLVENDVEYDYTYKVINNSRKLAITAEQNNAEAISHDFDPYLPESAQTPLLNMADYLYYGFATHVGDDYSEIEQTKLHTLYGLYDDVVWVRYKAYDVDKTNFKVPNEKAIVDSHVTKGAGSHDASLNINGGLPYNIIWYNDNMMQSTNGTTVSDGGSKSLSGTQDYVWYFTGGDPYALKIRHKKDGSYISGTSNSLVEEGSAMPFMLLKKTGYDYGILQVMGTTGSNVGKKLTGFGGALTADASTDPTKFVIFGLSVHDLIYRLIIASTCSDTTVATPPDGQYVDIPYRSGNENTYTTSNTWLSTQTKRIYGTTQRNLIDQVSGIAGDKYQLGGTVSWGGESHIYSKNVGTVSIGDDLWVPNEFYRPNCTFDFYIEGVYDNTGTSAETQLNNRFKGLKLKKLMSASELIDKTVVVNIVYHFNDTLITNSGLDFVRSKEQNLWYTFETPKGTTPYLAHYTNAWGLQAMEGAETHYTNDYLWTPLGDPYGFKMYNRYMLKNSGGTTSVMTMNNIAEGKNVFMAVPGTTLRPEGEDGAGTAIPADYGIFELITGNQDGYFRVHPMANNSGTQYYVRRGDSDYAVLSTTPTDWTFGLDMTLLEPYYERKGYVGGLTAEGKTKYETAVASGKITEIQKVVYNDANIVKYTPGYYRLHNQPGVSSISPVRYASGYLHDSEKTAVSGGIPMHFYSRKGVSTTFEGEDGLSTGFTETAATRGEIPVDSTEIDPSTIFYFPGTSYLGGNPRSTMQTQGLYVARNANGDGDNGTTTYKNQRAVMSENVADTLCFSLMDIGGAVLLIHDGAEPATRRYLNYDQSKADSIYDLKFYHNSPTDDAKWCMQPVQKTATAGNGEMPLFVKTNNGGDGYYYTTFYAPFDVLLPDDSGSKTYNAFIGTTWSNTNVKTAKVDAHAPYAEGKFVPAGTPVIIRTTDESGNVKLTLPTSSPSSPLASCVFAGSYLETLLANDASRDVYTLGLPFTSTVTKDGAPVTPGDISAPLPEFANTGVGFYINATRNKEINAMEGNWTRNNRYVLHNKIYYRAAASSRRMNVRPEFVPVIFDDDIDNEEQQEEQDDSSQPTADECIYDLQGRCVANQQQVKDGTWRTMLKPGIYILYSDEARRQGRSGRKFRKK